MPLARTAHGAKRTREKIRLKGYDRNLYFHENEKSNEEIAKSPEYDKLTETPEIGTLAARKACART